MQWFGCHADQGHDFQEFLLTGLTQLLYIVTT
jgi:hypothetical protein